MARSVYNKKAISFQMVSDYTRIMMCLYMEIIHKEHKGIQNFDLSLDCLDADVILESIKSEQASFARVFKKNLFDFKDKYTSDTGSIVLAMLMLSRIINNRSKGEVEDEQ